MLLKHERMSHGSSLSVCPQTAQDFCSEIPCSADRNCFRVLYPSVPHRELLAAPRFGKSLPLPQRQTVTTVAPPSFLRGSYVSPPCFLLRLGMGGERRKVGGGTGTTAGGGGMGRGKLDSRRFQRITMSESLELPRGLACLRVRTQAGNNSARESARLVSVNKPQACTNLTMALTG